MRKERIRKIIRPAMAVSFILMLLFAPDLLFADGGGLIWYQSYNLNEDNDYTRGVDAKQTLDGGYILTGETYSSLDLGGDGQTRAFLLKVDGESNILWNYSYDFGDGDSYDCTGAVVMVPSDEYYYLFGHKTCPELIIPEDAEIGVFLMKISNSEGTEGDTIWTRLYDRDINANYFVRDVCQTTDGGYAIFGYTDDPTEDLGSTGGYMIKLDADGNKEWSKIYDYEASSPFFLRSMDVRAGQQTSDGGYILAGTYEEQYSEGGDLYRYSYLVKTDSLGEITWSEKETGYDDTFNSIAQTATGAYIGGFLNDDYLPEENNARAFGVMKASDTGEYLWGTAFWPAANDVGMVCEAVEPVTLYGEEASYIASGYFYHQMDGEYSDYNFNYPMIMHIAARDHDILWWDYYDNQYYGIDEELGAYSVSLQVTQQGNYLLSGVAPGLTYDNTVYSRDKCFMMLVEGFFTTDIDETNSMPEEVALSQNYPNPFNASTVISYELNHDTEVKLDIFDVLGRKVATLVDEAQSAGTHTITWNAGNIVSGVYFYKIQADNFTDTRKMLLIK